MPDYRQKNQKWNIVPSKDGTFNWDQATVAVLMDIRDELRALNDLLGCPNFADISRTLKQIRYNTTKHRRVKK
jgi:hypothetical protein